MQSDEAASGGWWRRAFGRKPRPGVGSDSSSGASISSRVEGMRKIGGSSSNDNIGRIENISIMGRMDNGTSIHRIDNGNSIDRIDDDDNDMIGSNDPHGGSPPPTPAQQVVLRVSDVAKLGSLELMAFEEEAPRRIVVIATAAAAEVVPPPPLPPLPAPARGDGGEQGKSTLFQATLNCLSLLFGLGILSSPYAMAQAGWAGAGVSLAVAATYAYTAWLMGRCIDELSGKQQQEPQPLEPGSGGGGVGTYQDIARAALGPRLRGAVTALFYVEITGTLLGYCISIADNLDYLFPRPGFALPGVSNRGLMMGLAALAILPSVWLRDLSALAFTSVWCILSSFILLAGVLVAGGSSSGVGFSHGLPAARAAGLPVAAGLYAFSYGGTSVFPSIYKSMKDPSKFLLALLLSFSIAAASMLALGLAGAAMFGRRTRSQVTLSMPLHLASTKVVLWSTVVTPIFKFALQLSPITAALDAQLCRHGRSFDHKAAGSSSSSSSSPMFALLRILLRSSVLAAIVVGSLLFPYFQYVAALIGSSMTISICLIFPCIFYLKLFWRRLGRRSVAAVSALLLFGVLVAACGTAVALQGLIHSKRKHAS